MKTTTVADRDEAQRFVGENWDKPKVTITGHGRGRSPARKVVTPMGVRRIEGGKLLDEARRLLRAGHEVRIASKRTGDAIRLIPMMETDLATMIVCARTMGAFRKATLADKRARLVRHGEEVSAQDAADYMSARRAETPPCDEVTPDTTVTCPNCGTTFRVGRRIAA